MESCVDCLEPTTEGTAVVNTVADSADLPPLSPGDTVPVSEPLVSDCSSCKGLEIKVGQLESELIRVKKKKTKCSKIRRRSCMGVCLVLMALPTAPAL